MVTPDETSFVNKNCGRQIPITVTAKTQTVAGSLCEWSTDGQTWNKGSTACFKGAGATSIFTTQIAAPTSGDRSFTLYVRCGEFGYYDYTPFTGGVKDQCDPSDSISITTQQKLSPPSTFTIPGSVSNCHVPSFQVEASKSSIELDSGSTEQAAITVNNNEVDRSLTCTLSSEVQPDSTGTVSQSGSQQFTLNIVAPSVKKTETKNIVVEVKCTDLTSTLTNPRTKPLSVTYKPITGDLKISTTPSGAQIKIDGVLRGTTPMTVPDLPKGPRSLELTLTGYKTIIKSITIVAGEEVATEPFPLEPTTGGVFVSSTPSGAEITIDKTSGGVTDTTVKGLTEGSHTLEVYYKGYSKATKTIKIIAGETISEPVTLTPITGSITIDSTPSGATVEVNGQARGKTPTTITDLAVERTYSLTLRKEGYKPYPTQATLTETKKSESVSATLVESFPGVSVNFRATKTAIGLNEEAIVEFTATNRIGNNPTLKLQLIAKVPSGFTISSTTGAKSGGGQFSNDYEVKPGDSIIITLRIKPEQTGTAELTGEWTYFFEGQDKVTDKTAITFTVTEKAPSPASATQGGAGGSQAQPAGPSKSPGFEAALGLAALLVAAVWLGRRK